LANFIQQIWHNDVDEIELQIFLQTLFAGIISLGEKRLMKLNPWKERREGRREREREEERRMGKR